MLRYFYLHCYIAHQCFTTFLCFPQSCLKSSSTPSLAPSTMFQICPYEWTITAWYLTLYKWLLLQLFFHTFELSMFRLLWSSLHSYYYHFEWQLDVSTIYPLLLFNFQLTFQLFILLANISTVYSLLSANISAIYSLLLANISTVYYFS